MQRSDAGTRWQADTETLRRTPLHDLHVELGARMVPFAGYSMPVQYEGILAEHRWTREHAGLFDVSHMGQRFLVGPDHATTAAALEALTPGAFGSLGLGRMRYTLLLNDAGRHRRRSDGHALELGGTTTARSGWSSTPAARRSTTTHSARGCRTDVTLHTADDRALLALAGPGGGERDGAPLSEGRRRSSS